MPVVTSSLGAAAVTAIYLIYGAYRDLVRSRLRRDDRLRARVAFLLWNLAGTDAGDLDLSSPGYPGGHLGNHRFLLL